MAKNNNKKFAIYELFVGVIKEQYPKKLYPNQLPPAQAGGLVNACKAD